MAAKACFTLNIKIHEKQSLLYFEQWMLHHTREVKS